MIDSHIHLERYLDDEIAEQIKRWQEKGVEKVVAVSSDLKSAHRTLALKERFPRFIIAAIGYHPEQSPQKEVEREELIELLHRERKLISAIGEVGLPHYTLSTLTKRQIELHEHHFTEWVKKAKEVALPIAIHAVHQQAHRALSILQKYGVQGHFHWLKAPAEVLNQIVTDGHFISFTPDIVARTRDQALAKMVPIEQLLLETDGPWPFGGQFQGVKTVPTMVIEVAKAIADVKGETVERVLKITTQNAKSYYDNDKRLRQN